MRNKWQVQFDEVQRAITTTNNNNSNNINLAGNPGTASFVQFPTNTNPPNVYLSRLEEHSQPSQPAPSEGTSSMLSPTYMGSPSSPTANSNLHSTMNQGGVASANKMFSRRFLLEFLFIMKNMARLALSIGNGSINGALDIYYGRLFMTLESLSLRTPHTVSVTIPGPTVVTTLVNSTGAVTTEEEVHPPPSPKPAEAESHSPPPAHTRSISMDAIHMDSPGKAKHEINVVPKPMKRVSSLNADDAPLPRRTLVKSASAPYLEGSFNSTLMEPSPSDVLDALEPLACIVNTSLAHPATALLNFGNTSSSLLPRNTSSSFIPDENDLHILGDTNTFSDSHTSADGPVRQALTRGGGLTAGKWRHVHQRLRDPQGGLGCLQQWYPCVPP
ncbi:hypothetical protein AGDE_14686 [Angomonas deanei]|uniref:Uncharacterized protein n=1 Tax=Angomonas deanei TaxID=59799 RepID=A0A7G2CFM2_9TRYP|nr:hypothetical protein AGDE_14686 [Angomonas deanei]CAD2217761.1 hypothetical protein, conserved [Angomonas deanei]|eukprot:EPY20417.1 hypothetical protein AGDE_14686 [Angomonas deanei]